MKTTETIQTPTESSPTLLNVHDAAGYFRSLGAKAATVNFVRSLLLSGQLPYTQVGRAFYVTKDDIHTWISRRSKRARP
jgi:hypothetical protein